MENFARPVLRLLLLASLPFMPGCQPGCQRPSPVLMLDNSSTVRIDTVFPNTPAGNLVREHVRASMGHGEDAEAQYQQSLTTLRAEPEAGQILYNAYRKVAPENYFYRNMIVEALKQLRSEGSLAYLNEIAADKIPADREPENAEIDTRQDEVVIRVTAVEGIALLAADSLAEAERSLRQLIGHEDLTVRQMATRGYLQSPFGNREEKIQELRQRLPQTEHWYITTEATDIKKVAHPAMPEQFDLPKKQSENAPKIKQK
jgi:hypothetical protein